MTGEELIEMLKILKGQALKSCKDTTILDVKIDSFIFVIDKAIEVLAQQPCDYYDADNKTCRRVEVPKESCEDVLDKIKTIVDEWKADTWTDNISYECMVKIADILAESEVKG